MSTTLEQQRYRAGSHSLHIVHQGDLGWSVWLNVEDIDFSGLCLATGATRGDAQGAAIRVLYMLAGVLERPPVPECWLCKGKKTVIGLPYGPVRVECNVCNGTGRLG